MSSNLGRWDRWNTGDEPGPYANTATYRLAAYWLASCETVEDWGCGRTWFSTLRDGDYIGVDGSGTYADVIADLADYRSSPDGILLRHVLEHDHRWQQILDNAVASFKQRMCLIVFTPLAERTHEIAFNDDLGVPDISFSADEIEHRLIGCRWTRETLVTESQYETETIWRIER